MSKKSVLGKFKIENNGEKNLKKIMNKDYFYVMCLIFLFVYVGMTFYYLVDDLPIHSELFLFGISCCLLDIITFLLRHYILFIIDYILLCLLLYYSFEQLETCQANHDTYAYPIIILNLCFSTISIVKNSYFSLLFFSENDE